MAQSSPPALLPPTASALLGRGRVRQRQTASPCRIVCNTSGSGSNEQQFECAAGEACTLRCEESGACNASTVMAGSASTFCMQCNGNAGCSSVACTTAPLLCGMSCGIGGIGCFRVACNCTIVLTCL